MASINKLLAASDRVQLPEQSVYILPANKMFYLIQTAGAWAIALIMTVAQLKNPSAGGWQTYYLLINVVLAIYGLAALLAAFSAKVVIDDEKIAIPAFYPFMTEKLRWEDIDRAELTGVITYRYYITLIVKKLLPSIFANIELHVTYRNSLMPGAKGNFPIFQRVGDRATALKIIREKLGNRFLVYEGEY